MSRSLPQLQARSVAKQFLDSVHDLCRNFKLEVSQSKSLPQLQARSVAKQKLESFKSERIGGTEQEP
ncbi:hypothetical protein WG66_005475 [Moniliophthora roreri]|nr:hypothetical protein WG66_005475 [Moniliophthora roreri]